MLLIFKATYSGSIGTSLFKIKWHARKESWVLSSFTVLYFQRKWNVTMTVKCGQVVLVSMLQTTVILVSVIMDR